MGNSRARLILVAAMSLAALTTFGSVPATAAPDARPSAAAAPEFRPTTIVAGRPNALGIHLSMAPMAKLTDTQTGAPLAGFLVSFVISEPFAGHYALCHGTTDAAGVVKCGGVKVLYQIYLGRNTYRAWFQGKEQNGVYHMPSEDTVRLFARQ